jgi:hypothetical protein
VQLLVSVDGGSGGYLKDHGYLRIREDVNVFELGSEFQFCGIFYI